MRFVSVLIAWLCLCTASTASTADSFESLLTEAGLEFQAPSGFEKFSQDGPNPIFPYEYAVRTTSGDMEIRYAIRPLSRIAIEYQDPHSSAPHPNDLFKMLFDQIAIELAGSRDTFENTYPPDQTVGLFNAQWAAVAMFDIDQRFSEDYQQALLIAIHRDDLADAYVICLFNSYDDLKARIPEIQASLKFATPLEQEQG